MGIHGKEHTAVIKMGTHGKEHMVVNPLVVHTKITETSEMFYNRMLQILWSATMRNLNILREAKTKR